MKYLKITGVFFVLCFVNIFAIISSYAANIPAGFSIDNIDISGKNAADAKAAVEDYSGSLSVKSFNLNVNGKTESFNAGDVGLSFNNYNDILNSIEENTSGNVVVRYKRELELNKNPFVLNTDISIDSDMFNKSFNKKFEGVLGEAVNAKISRKGGQFVVSDSKDGVKLDVEQTKNTIVSVLSKNESDIPSVDASVTVDTPKVKADDLKQIKDLLGTYTTDYSSSSAARATNVEVGAGKINGHVLMPGETLSGYECMHPFTQKNGYKIASAYENGRVVDSVGGGACQIASTLYNASLRAEVKITQRQNHSMVVGYVPASCDAAIAGTYKDIKITNNRSTPIYVEAFSSNRKLTFNIWGKEDRPSNRSVEFVSEIISQTPAGITYQDDPTLPIGKEIKVESGHNGRQSKLWKVVKVDGKVVSKDLLSSDTYRVSNSIVKRGTMPVEVAQTQEAAQPAEEVAKPDNSGPSGSVAKPKKDKPKEDVKQEGPGGSSSSDVIAVPVGPT